MSKPLSSLSTTQRKAIEFNNIGVEAGMKGNNELAIQSFSSSLSLFKKLVAVEEESAASTASAPPRSLHSTCHALPHLQNSGFFVWNSILSLAQPSANSVFQPEDCHTYCALIILNLAVVYHQIALQHPSAVNRSDALKRAERFYDMVTKILAQDLTDAQEQQQQQQQPTAILARLAALNNLAYLQLERGDVKSSCACFHFLAWLVNNMSFPLEAVHQSSSEPQQQKQQQKSLNFLEEQDLEGMMLNVLMANRSAVAPAA